MFDNMASKMAQVLTEYSVEIKPGDYVYMVGSVAAEPLIMALYEAILERGGNPTYQAQFAQTGELFFRKANDAQLDFVNPTFETVVDKADVYMVIDSPFNTKSMSSTDPAKMARTQQAQQRVIEKFFQRLSNGMRYNVTLWPTNASAQQAEKGLLAYTEFVYNACALGEADPVQHWRVFHDRQERLVQWLKGKKHAEVHGPGVDLSFDFAERPWVNCDGKLNFPDGEIFTCPVEDSVNGHVEFSYPSLYMGREVEGVKLTFKDGCVTEASAAKNEDHLLAQLKVDEGAQRLGEFAIGTNNGVQEYSGNTLFDEKIGGSIHMALGNSAPMGGGANHSSIHWDIVHSMLNGGEIMIDGEVFYRSGKFLVE